MQEAINIWGLPAPPSLVLFDLDGTLVDSLDDLGASVNFMRAEFGLSPLDLDDVRLCIGKGARNLVARTMPPDDGRIDEALRVFLGHNGQTLAVHSRLFPGARELLASLRGAGIPLAVVSNKTPDIVSFC